MRLEEGEPWARCVQETERGSPGGLRAHLEAGEAQGTPEGMDGLSPPHLDVLLRSVKGGS